MPAVEPQRGVFSVRLMMSEKLLRQLRFLEEDYPGMPRVVQQADLQEINRLRAELDLPPVDERLRELGTVVVDEAVVEPSAEDELESHAEARVIYRRYLQKVAALQVHREYAEQVSKATAGRGQTPVRPLATMGTGGGPLLCDQCGQPIVLEGGDCHGMSADEAWKLRARNRWTSWILGGMVVEIETNGTLRIYHGYPDRSASDCCNVASRKDEQARAAHDSSARTGKWPMILAFIEHEFLDLPTPSQTELLNDILDTVYEYDPGLGVNRPG